MKTEQEKLEYLNQELDTDYNSLDEVNWWYIAREQKLTEKFIRMFQDKLDWSAISLYQILSEDFMREMKDYVNWNYIAEFHTLSKELSDYIKELE